MASKEIKTEKTDDSFSAKPATFDMKALARERMAGQGSLKRERSISPPPPRKAPKLEETQHTLPSGARLNFFSSVVQEDQQGRKSAAANAAMKNLKAETQAADMKTEFKEKPTLDCALNPESLPAGAIRYPQGVVKNTWAFSHARDGRDIKLEEVLEAASLQTAVISAFQWDTDWLLAKLKVPPNGGSTKLVFVMQAKEQSLKDKMLKESEYMRPWLRLCFPPMDGQVHCMHSKLMLLFHSEKLRIAVPTANLLDFDWGETGMMENTVFIIDLPRLQDGGKVDQGELTFFGKELLYFLEKQGCDQDVRDGILSFDFAETKDIAFVHTVGGIFYGDEAERTGLPGLAQAVRHLGIETDRDTQVDFAASSIGSLNESFLLTVHAAVTGRDMLSRASKTESTAKANFFKPSAKSGPIKPDRIGDKMRIYFPTNETVTSSKAGAAGTICFSRKWWEAPTFPKHCFRDYVSTRKGLLSHNKLLYARGKHAVDDGKVVEDVAWAYVGSANVSESAWGKLVHDKKAKAWKLNAKNWECGVLLPVPQEKLAALRKKSEPLPKEAEKKAKKEEVESEDSETESEDEGVTPSAEIAEHLIVGIDVFDEAVRPPFEIPGAEYGGRQPWYFQERH